MAASRDSVRFMRAATILTPRSFTSRNDAE
jgi:hypothetical protein